MAAVKPITPPAWRGSNSMGICLKVLALPTPAKKNRVNMPATNIGKLSRPVGLVSVVTQTVEASIPRPAQCVTRAPPSLSDSGPATTRAAEPTSGP